MPPLNGVVLPGTVVPSDSTDTYAVIDPQYGIDGIRSVLDKATRNAIPLPRRRQGMCVVIQQDFGLGINTVWQLKPPPWNNTDTDWGNLFSSMITAPVGGDLSGTLPNPTVVSTNGIPFGTMAVQNANGVNITGGTITGLLTPVSASDAANKSYVDAVTTGLSPKNACRLATTTNLNATYSNGASGVGATLTNAGAFSPLTIEGITVSTNDRILVKNQTDASQNGIYSATSVGSASSAWFLTRTIDYNSPTLVAPGTYTVVGEGTVNGGTFWLETGVGPFTIGTTPVVFTQLNMPPLNITFNGDVYGTGSGNIATTVLSINGTPLGSTTAVAGNLLVASGSQWVSVHPSGDAAVSANGLITVTKTNSVPFAPSATTDTTNAANITSGVISTARLGIGTATTTTFLRGDGSWQLIPSTPPAGTDTQIQYNSNGAAGASPNLTFNYTTSTLTATNIAGSGANITNLNASNLSSGVVSTALLGSGSANATTFLRGDGVWAIPSGAASSISIGSSVTGGTSKSVLYVDSNDFLAQDNSNLNYNPNTHSFTATNLVGAGAGITNINASNISSGTVPIAVLGTGTPSASTFLRGDNTWQAIPSNPPAGADTQVQYNAGGSVGASPNFTFNYNTSTLTATNISGSGAGITNLNGSNIASGVVPAAHLGSGTTDATTFLRGDNTWAAPMVIGGLVAGSGTGGVLFVDNSNDLAEDSNNFYYLASTHTLFAANLSGSGSGITNLNASNLSSGTVPTAQLGSGTASVTTFLRGDNTWQPITASASAITYSNIISGLPSTNVQSAIDTLSSLIANRNVSNGTTLISGGGVAWVSGYTFRVSAATYYIANVFYSSLEQTVTLTTPDPTNDRIDAIVLDSTGTVSAIAGVPAPIPVPPLVDSRTYLELTHVTVKAASTQPVFFTKILVYDENVGTPAEWTTTPSGTGWVLSSTNNPYTGTKDIEATGVTANAYIQFAPTSAIDPTTLTQLVIHVRSKAAWSNKISLSIAWYSSGTRQGSAVALGTGSYGFDSTITGAYQQIVLPIGLFALAAGTVCNQLRMTVLGGGPGIGFYLDDVELQSNSGALPSGYPSIIGPLTLLGNPSSTGPAIPSAITLGSGFTVTGTTVSVSAAGAAGADQQVQFNKGGVFGAAAGFSYNYTTNILSASKFAGDGSQIINLNAFNFSSGTMPTARLGSGTANATTFLAGNNTWQTVPSGAVTLTGDVTGAGTGSVATTVAKINGNPLGSTTPTGGNVLIGSGAQWISNPISGDANLGPGGTITVTRLLGTPIGSSTPTMGNILIASGSNWASQPVSGDAALAYPGVITVTKTNGVAFAPSATINTTDATNITSGTLPTARLGSGTANATTYLRGDNTWQPISSLGGTPAGIDQQIQINRGGAFGVANGTNFTYNYTTNILSAPQFSGDGSLLTNLNANNLAAGQVATARLGSGTANNTTYLRGDNTWVPVAAGSKSKWVLGAGTPVTVGADKTAWDIIDQNRTMSLVYIAAKTAPAGATLIIDILFSTNNGTSWTSLWAINPGNRPTLAIGAKFATVTAFDTTTLAASTLLRIDVIQVGSTTPGQDVTVQLQYQ